MQEKIISKAIKFLEDGQVVGIPTETVYGLAADAYNASAVNKVFSIKKRPLTSPMIVHTCNITRVMPLITHMPSDAMHLAKHFWPGPLTLLLDKSALIPHIVNAGLPKVGIRVPKHPLTQELLERLPFPLVAPSANPFGYISPTKVEHVRAQLGSEVPYVLDGGTCKRGLESTIVGFEKGKTIIYRLGSVTQEEIEAVIGSPVISLPYSEKEAHLTPGRTKKHYSPHTPIIVGDLPILAEKYKAFDVVVLCFDTHLDKITHKKQIILSPKGSLEEAAQRLFEVLHILDSRGADLIIAPVFPQEGLGRVINERLLRASS
ncbi:MAG: L-threonylcarbamoyladenylate synthase [Bacteroidota bacterium]